MRFHTLCAASYDTFQPPPSHEGSRIGISESTTSVASPEGSKEDEERKARHRRESLKELVETERGYVRDLSVLFKV